MYNSTGIGSGLGGVVGGTGPIYPNGTTAPATRPAIPPGGCPFNLAFDSYHNFTSGLLDVVLPDGSVVCSSDKAQVQPGTHPYANASWLTPVIQRGSATILGPIRDPITNKWSLYIGAPVPAPNAPATASPPYSPSKKPTAALSRSRITPPRAPSIHRFHRCFPMLS